MFFRKPICMKNITNHFVGTGRRIKRINSWIILCTFFYKDSSSVFIIKFYSIVRDSHIFFSFFCFEKYVPSLCAKKIHTAISRNVDLY